MKVANTQGLLTEELIDLLFEITTLENIKKELEFNDHDLSKYGYYLSKLRTMTAFIASCLSGRNDYDLIQETSSFREVDGYVDISDLKYFTEKADKNLVATYGREVSDQNKLLLELIEHYLIKMKYHAKVG